MSQFPAFLNELLANPPTAGNGIHNWLFCAARQLHVHMGTVEMERLLLEKAQECGRHVPIQEIRDAIKNSQTCAWTPTEQGPENSHAKPEPKNPPPDIAAIDRIVTNGIGLYDLWERSEIRFGGADNPPQTEVVIDSIFPGNPLLWVGKTSEQFATAPAQRLARVPKPAAFNRSQSDDQGHRNNEIRSPQ